MKTYTATIGFQGKVITTQANSTESAIQNMMKENPQILRGKKFPLDRDSIKGIKRVK